MSSSMTASWIAYSLLVGALLAATALGLESLLRLANRPARWVWAGAIALTLALSLIAPHRAAGPGRLRVLPSLAFTPPAAAPSPLVRQRGPLAALVAAERAAVDWTQRQLARADRVLPAGADRGLGALWLAATGTLVLLFGAVYLRFARARRRWPVAELHGERVRIAPEAGPAVVGLSQPEIVVPRWLLARSAEEQRLVLVHEREHVLARDPLLLAAACAAAALLPWSPAVWWMLSRLHLAVELDCDHRVLRRGVPARSYGTLLIDLAGRCSGLPVGAPALADRSSHLERRLLAMLPTRPRLTRVRAAALGTVAALALLAACEAKMPTAAEVDQMDASKATATAQHFQFMKIGDPNTTYTVDGRAATSAEAAALKPNEIATIDVRKENRDGVASSSVNIHTRAAMGLAPVAMGDSGQQVQVMIRRRADGTTDTSATSLKMHMEQNADGSAKTRIAVGDAAMAGEHKMKMRDFDGIVVLDGVRVDAAKLATLAPNDIVSMEVIKGDAATKLYAEPAAANGVIKITTKNAKK
jgi:bla regulator protein blaR1